MRKRYLIAANWKMHKTLPEAVAFARALKYRCSKTDGVYVVLCPAAPALAPVVDALEGSSIGVGAQNLHWDEEGAYTGETSAAMVLSTGASHVLIGHSERRHGLGETDIDIARKLRQALKVGLSPILCVGETLEERKAAETMGVVQRQVESALDGVDGDLGEGTTIAYEPVWAIGTGHNASPQEAEEVHAFIRRILSRSVESGINRDVPILYGGSVTPENARAILATSNIDGALVGGASLQVETFARIVSLAQEMST